MGRSTKDHRRRACVAARPVILLMAVSGMAMLASLKDHGGPDPTAGVRGRILRALITGQEARCPWPAVPKLYDNDASNNEGYEKSFKGFIEAVARLYDTPGEWVRLFTTCINDIIYN